MRTNPEFNYDCLGATDPAAPEWVRHPAGYRAYERTVSLGHGPAVWQSATTAVSTWQIKTRSGFTVDGPHQARAGARYTLTARFGPVIIREPVQVVAVVDRPERVGFSYDLSGHPVSGEEAFIVHRTPDDRVRLTIRSLTRSTTGVWRRVFPLLLIAQSFYRRRYLRALLPAS